MSLHQFCKKAIVFINQTEYELIREVAENLWQLEDKKTGRFHEYTMDSLKSLYADGSLLFPRDPISKDHLNQAGDANSRLVKRDVSEEALAIAKYKLAFVKGVEGLPKTDAKLRQSIQSVSQKFNDNKKPPHPTTVCRWVKQYMQYGKDIFALVDQHHHKGNREERYIQDVLDLVKDSIDVVYLKRERKTIVDTYEDAIVRVDRVNKERPGSMQLPLPTLRLVRRLIHEIPFYDRHAARYGRLAASRFIRAKLKHHFTKGPLDVAQIDHTQLDLFVVDEQTGMPMGRPWITICLDVHTRCVLGFYIGFESPSYLSVGKCLKHAILPKVNLKNDFPDINNAWEAYGVMDRILVDNGLEFHSHSLEQACLSLGISIEFTPRKKPWFKGHVERFNRTINAGVSHGIAGTSFSNIFEKDDYDPVKHAIITLDVLRHIVHKWIADYYHQKPHRGLDQYSPAAFWAANVKAEDITMAHDPAEINKMLGRTIPEKSITHKGIELNGLLYNSPELMQLRRIHGDGLKADIRIDESDIGQVYVVLEQNQGYLTVPALNIDYAKGMSKWLHEKCRQFAKDRIGKSDPLTWARAKVQIAEIVEDAMNFKRKKKHAPQVGRYRDESKKNKPLKTKVVPLPNLNQSDNSSDNLDHVRIVEVPKYSPVVQSRTKNKE